MKLVSTWRHELPHRSGTDGWPTLPVGESRAEWAVSTGVLLGILSLTMRAGIDAKRTIQDSLRQIAKVSDDDLGGAPVAKHALEVLSRHLPEVKTVRALAKLLRCHPVYLPREFRKLYGLGVSECIRFVRVGAALAHIAASDTQITAISGLVGFSGRASQFRAVVKVTGHSPSHWRSMALRMRHEQTLEPVCN